MSTVVPPLQAHTIELLLAHLSPPSQLTEPLPSHLVSRALLQRHHFLQLSPAEDIRSYLCWPSDSANSDAAISAVESLYCTADSDASAPRMWHVRYTHDGEFFFAHAAAETPPDNARIVFCWADEQWRYHNLALTPFPANATEEPEDGNLSTISVDVPQIVRPHSEAIEVLTSATDDSGDDDSYWNAYGAQDDDDDDDESAGLSSSGRAKRLSHGTDESEDAYWAQYAAVQGELCFRLRRHVRLLGTEHYRRFFP
jgi:hypothetical protein